MDATVQLQSSDEQIFEVEIKVALMSATIKVMLETLGMEGEVNDEVIPVTNVKGTILEKVVEWCKKHVDDEDKPELDDNHEKRSDDIPEWDVDFLKVDQQTLFAIIRAANFLDIKGLMDVTCKTVANMIKGKTPEEIRKTFNIVPVPAPENPDDKIEQASTSRECSGEKKFKE
ncbi:Similar to Skp1: S-phase kinase-associated protein 1 (Rattus norvegicus) [Cotesia congregata]|uniref:Similar to Skp1: S-phase kinase-associated protein 1 (Rattus norvegicus) n=1 Tax=Cotesia congregata TaxID=51543 RepID=A0A8J2MR71_COTCN|nr:Similar to Skp1: S-phase kinase-associated protein 1 (Rattus norvegicus) [Cotesia congregata]